MTKNKSEKEKKNRSPNDIRIEKEEKVRSLEKWHQKKVLIALEWT